MPKGCPCGRMSGPPFPLARSLDAFAPSVRDGFFLVPRLSTHESHGGIVTARSCAGVRERDRRRPSSPRPRRCSARSTRAQRGGRGPRRAQRVRLARRRGRAVAGGVDRAIALADTTPGALLGVPVAIKDNIATLAHADHLRVEDPRGLREPVRGDGREASARGGRDPVRQDEHGRVRDGLVHGAQRVRTDAGTRSRPTACPADRRAARPSPSPSGIVADRARLGDRRLGAPARGVLRHRRREADLWPREPLRARRLRLVARSGRRLRRHCRRRRARARRHRRPRSDGLDLGDHRRARVPRRRRRAM